MSSFEQLSRFDPARHDVTGFDCASDSQTRWLRRIAAMAQIADTSVTYVLTPEGSDRVVGYYALAAASVAPEGAPSRLRKGAGSSPIPVILLARLGVDRSVEGQGVGRALVKDAMLRAANAASTIGARALLIHAETPSARDFYLHVAEFDPSPTDPLHLFLLMRDIRAIVDPLASGE